MLAQYEQLLELPADVKLQLVDKIQFSVLEHLLSSPVDVKLQLIDELQLSIDNGGEEDAPALDDSILQEAKERIAAMQADPTLGISLEEMWKQLDAARG